MVRRGGKGLGIGGWKRREGFRDGQWKWREGFRDDQWKMREGIRGRVGIGGKGLGRGRGGQ